MRIVVKDRLAELENLVRTIRAEPGYYKEAVIVMTPVELREVLTHPKAPVLLEEYFGQRAQSLALLTYNHQKLQEEIDREHNADKRQELFDKQTKLDGEFRVLEQHRNVTNLEVCGIPIRTSQIV